MIRKYLNFFSNQEKQRGGGGMEGGEQMIEENYQNREEGERLHLQTKTVTHFVFSKGFWAEGGGIRGAGIGRNYEVDEGVSVWDAVEQIKNSKIFWARLFSPTLNERISSHLFHLGQQGIDRRGAWSKHSRATHGLDGRARREVGRRRWEQWRSFPIFTWKRLKISYAMVR